MSSVNLDLVRSIVGAWERGDFSSAEWAHPEIELVVADGPEPGRWTGLAEVAAAGRSRLSPVADYRLGVEEFRELDNERTLVLVYPGAGRGKTSGVAVDQLRSKGAILFHLRDGKVTRLALHWDRDRALADLGLAAEGEPAVSMGAHRTNVEMATAALDAFNRRDPEAYIRDGRLRADYEWRPFMTAGIEGGVYHGHDGIREWFATLDEMFETFSAELFDVCDAGERVVVLGTLRGRGRASGVPVESPVGIVVELDAYGLARRGIAFTTHAEALADAGLSAKTDATR